MPLTGNGKLDRAALAAWAEQRGLESARSVEGEQQEATELHRAIARVYGEVLDKADISHDVNFYSLGGDSLLAAQVVTQLRENVPEATTVLFDELLRELLDGASVHELAAFLGDGATAEADTTDKESYVLTGATEAIGNPVHVLINDGFGEDAVRLGELLGERDPVVQIPYLEVGEAPEIDELAQRIVRQVRTLSPGPFHLVGARGGGLLALSAAQQLSELGVPVCGLTLVSSYPLPAVIRDEVLYEAMFVQGAGADPAELGYFDEAALGRALAELVPAARYPPARWPGSRTIGTPGCGRWRRSPPGSAPAAATSVWGRSPGTSAGRPRTSATHSSAHSRCSTPRPRTPPASTPVTPGCWCTARKLPSGRPWPPTCAPTGATSASAVSTSRRSRAATSAAAPSSPATCSTCPRRSSDRRRSRGARRLRRGRRRRAADRRRAPARGDGPDRRPS
ncbi:phosphopantetheine-binding protein [Streptomyces sp. GD-15H]|uniref:phosphopantetheine-binding protein n=1 Tax=Streptomyces sp. GD-15H TaxID=3129112 RepID=UPI0032511995